MKKTFLAMGLFALFLLFSGCIHGSLDVTIPDGITTRMSGDQNYTYYFFSEGEGYADTISGTFTATKDGQPTEYTATYACLTYTIEDSASVKSNIRYYGFELTGTNTTDSNDTITIASDNVQTGGNGLTGYTYTDCRIVTYSGDYGYDGYRQKEFDLEIIWDAMEGSGTSAQKYTVQYDCHFKRTSD